MAFILLLCFEQFVFHQWRVYDYDRARWMDYGVYDKSNIPMTRHNQKLFNLYRTQVNFSDFADFVSVEVQDVVNYKKKKGFKTTEQDLKNYEDHKSINQDTVFSRA